MGRFENEEREMKRMHLTGAYVVKRVQMYMEPSENVYEVEMISDLAMFAKEEDAYEFAAKKTADEIMCEYASTSTVKMMYTVHYRKFEF